MAALLGIHRNRFPVRARCPATCPERVAMTITPPVPTAVPANPPAPPNTPPSPPADPVAPPAADDKPLGPAGERALQAERDARQALEKELAPLKQLAAALAGGKPPAGKTEIELINERLAAQDRVIAEQAAAILRAEVGDEKKLTKEQAALLIGSTREELTAHADRLLAAYGSPAGEDPKGRSARTPRPDPAQGAQPGTKPTGAEAGRAEAAKRFAKPAAST